MNLILLNSFSFNFGPKTWMFKCKSRITSEKLDSLIEQDNNCDPLFIISIFSIFHFVYCLDIIDYISVLT